MMKITHVLTHCICTSVLTRFKRLFLFQQAMTRTEAGTEPAPNPGASARSLSLPGEHPARPSPIAPSQHNSARMLGLFFYILCPRPEYDTSAIAVLLSSAGLNPNCALAPKAGEIQPAITQSSPRLPLANHHAQSRSYLPLTPARPAPDASATRGEAARPLCVGHSVLTVILCIRPRTSNPSQRQEPRQAGVAARLGLPCGLLAQLGSNPGPCNLLPSHSFLTAAPLPCAPPSPVPQSHSCLSIWRLSSLSDSSSGKPPRLGPSAQMPTPPTVLRGRYTCALQSQLCHPRKVPVVL